jgi:hypothetical protein
MSNTVYDKYILLVIAIKVLFVVFSVSHLIMKIKHEEGTELDEKFLFWKERIEFVFIVLMSLLLIYLFNPRQNHTEYLTFETKFLLYIFGFIMLFTSKWGIFIHESPIFKRFQSILK